VGSSHGTILRTRFHRVSPHITLIVGATLGGDAIWENSMEACGIIEGGIH
jgi:hypothetical protein